ncbi:hypothetical protein HHK36_019337 [Tetracentron sinense]|uniref:Protein BIC1 n=1 Tax=Tetracentron sinense TaxID=13715 RepID=A0A834Z139_TETSI|nr:hypothetical protein HHK36_019337 [Tetracentron sinense]
MRGPKNMIRRSYSKAVLRTPVAPSEPKKTCQPDDDQVELQGTSLNTHQSNGDNFALQGSSLPIVDVVKNPIKSDALPEDSGRERLKRHRAEVAGQVWIPEMWGQEELLKDWIDCSAFDASLVPTGIMSARAALVGEGPRAKSRQALKLELDDSSIDILPFGNDKLHQRLIYLDANTNLQKLAAKNPFRWDINILHTSNIRT